MLLANALPPGRRFYGTERTEIQRILFAPRVSAVLSGRNIVFFFLSSTFLYGSSLFYFFHVVFFLPEHRKIHAMSLGKEDGAVEKLMEEGCNDHKKLADNDDQDSKYDELNKLEVTDRRADTAYAGMGKEELMKYANSPFWVRLRWLLFVTFWLSWFAMMFGALFIIFMSPKCLSVTKLEWFQRSPVYVVNAASLVGQEGEHNFAKWGATVIGI